MRIVVCIRQGLDKEINPFDACAYEEALRIKGAEVILLSMAPESAKDFLLKLTRLGASRAILLCDRAFAGADTLATAYALSMAIKKLSPDLIFCGRQTLVGDTAQTAPMLSVLAGTSLITNVMQINEVGEQEITCTTRQRGTQTAALPTTLTVERINTLRFPALFSKTGEVEIWSAEDVGADPARCGLGGSPTRVLKTFENTSGKRKCRRITPAEFGDVLKNAQKKQRDAIGTQNQCEKKLGRILCVGENTTDLAQGLSEELTVIPLDTPERMAELIRNADADAVLWPSDDLGKATAAEVAARLSLGLCADCTALESDGDQLIMYRPALSGSIIAKIISRTRPAMASVRSAKESGGIVLGLGFGARESMEELKQYADAIGAELAASRKAVDNQLMPYRTQVGLTGKTVCPPIYVAVGISGAVHHIVGMQRAGCVIAINPDPDAPIFEYADFGIVCDVKTFLEAQKKQ